MGGYLNVSNSNFTKNTAETGGTLKYSFSAINLTMDNCIFKENKATDGYGADVDIPRGFNVTQTIKNSKFINSNAKGYGGAIRISSTNINIINSSFTNTVSSDNGAAVYISNASASSKPSRPANTVESVIIDGCNFTGTETYHAVYVYSKCNVSVTDSNFVNNVAGENPCIYFNGPMTSITLKGTNFTDNTATNSNGGALSVTISNSGLSSIDDCVFTNNKANVTNSKGGAVYLSNNDIALNGCDFISNTAYYGGALYLDSCTGADITDSTFSNNKATAINSDGGAIVIESSPTNIYSCEFDGNSAITGGAIHIKSTNSPTVTIDKSKFTNNKATRFTDNGDYCDGAAIRWDSTGGVLNNSIFINNVADGYAGAICWDSTTDFSTTNSSFINNAAKRGGALYIRNSLTNMIITKTNFTSNKANDDIGGAICVQAGVTNMELTACNFTANEANTIGGAVYAGASTTNLDIVKSIFNHNTAESYGGGVYSYSNTNLYVNESSFNYNEATQGGAIHTTGYSPKIYSSNFTSNKAIDNIEGCGGAIYLTGNDAVIDDSYFKDNHATIYGGAVSSKGSNTKITDSQFITNTVDRSGGALGLEGNSASVVNSNFTLNTAHIYGGAIYSIGNNSNFSKSNFNKNTATTQGGAIHLEGNHDSVDGSNFINNSAASGGAIHWVGNNGNLANSNFTENKATMYGGAIWW